MGIVMGTLVFGTRTASYQTCISDIKGQSVGKLYIYWCNWRSLNLSYFELYSPIKTTMDKLRSGNENYARFCSLKVNGLAT